MPHHTRPAVLPTAEGAPQATPDWSRVSAGHVGKAIAIVRQNMDENIAFFTQRPLR